MYFLSGRYDLCLQIIWFLAAMRMAVLFCDRFGYNACILRCFVYQSLNIESIQFQISYSNI